MTVAAQQSKQVFLCDGQTTAFPIPFPLSDKVNASDLLVFLVDPTEAITPLGNGWTYNAGPYTVTYPSVGPAQLVGYKLILLRSEQLAQLLSLTDTGIIPPKTLEATLDKMVMSLQQLQEQIDRCVKYPLDQTAGSVDVNAFIAAVSAAIAPLPLTGTLDSCKRVAALNPNTPLFAIVSDQGTPGAKQLYWYSGSVSVGDGGWFGPLAGG